MSTTKEWIANVQRGAIDAKKALAFVPVGVGDVSKLFVDSIDNWLDSVVLGCDEMLKREDVH